MTEPRRLPPLPTNIDDDADAQTPSAIAYEQGWDEGRADMIEASRNLIDNAEVRARKAEAERERYKAALRKVMAETGTSTSAHHAALAALGGEGEKNE
jgi:hypothetical protein